jgi:anaerobic selenocysteine-containing dehydrogenase
MKLRTACPLDCPDTCSLEVTVEDGRIVDIDAAPVDEQSNPLTNGWICKKVKHHADRVYSPERILTPLVRVGAKGEGKFRQASWDEAIQIVAGKIRSAIDEFGPGSVIPYLYNSSSARIDKKRLMPHLFERLGCPEVEQTICASTKSAAWEWAFGAMLSTDPLDVVHAKLLVVWGGNPGASNTHLLPLITEAKKNGAKLVVMDPRQISIANQADVHLAVRPGTDVVLGYAIASWLVDNGHVDRDFVDRHVIGFEDFVAASREWSIDRAAEVCGVNAADIVRVAEWIATIKPAMLRTGWGMERNRNGASGYLAAFGVWAIAGHFGIRGSGILDSTSKAFPNSVFVEWPKGIERPDRGKINMNRVGRVLNGDLTEWPTAPRVLVIQGANPAVTSVDQVGMLEGLAREEIFMVLHEQVMTDTARFADVVFPATSHFEINDVVGSYGSFTAQANNKVIDRVGESRSNGELAEALAVALGFSRHEFDASDEAIKQLVNESLCTGSVVVREAGETIQFRDTFPTFKDAKMRLWRSDHHLAGPRFIPLDDADHPLTLITPATTFTINSMFADTAPPPAVVKISPNDAQRRNVTNGQLVEVVNDRASIRIVAEVDASMRDGVCSIPKGLWRRSMDGGLTANAFAPDTFTDLSDGACFNDARVEIRTL